MHISYVYVQYPTAIFVLPGIDANERESFRRKRLLYWLILKLRNYDILSFWIKLIPLHEIAQKRPVLFLFQTNFVNSLYIAFFQFYDGRALKYDLSQKKKGLLNLVVKDDFRWKTKCKFYFFIRSTSFHKFVDYCFRFGFGGNTWVVLVVLQIAVLYVVLKSSFSAPVVNVFET